MKCFNFALTALAVFCATLASARPDVNAFLNFKATSVRALVEQAKRDPAVMDRYQRHYAMSRQEVLAFLSTLQVSRMPSAGVHSIYSVPPDGHIKMRLGKVRAGTQVFSDMTGNPMLIAKCGNPLNRGPNEPVAKNDNPDLLSRQREDLREISPDVDLPASEDFYSLAPDVPTSPEEIVTINKSPVIILPAAFGFNPLLLLGLPFLIGGGDDDTFTNPIPEPMTMLTLGSGLAYLMIRRRRR